jgi:dCMP deaminase
MSRDWDRWFLGLAQYVSTASKDPSTKVGAVIVDQKRRVVSVGYNGFARGVSDSQERYADRQTKYKMVVHAERNAILFAGRSLEYCTLYTWPFCPCSVCAAMVIQAGITRVVAPMASPELLQRWGEDMDLSRVMFHEAVVKVDLLDYSNQKDGQ